MADMRNTITAAIQESPSPGSVAPPADAGNGPIVLVVPLGWIDRDHVPKRALQTVSVEESDKSLANLRVGSHIRGFRCAIAAHPFRGKSAASRHNRDRASSSAKFVLRTSGQVPKPPPPWVASFEDLPRRGSRSSPAQPDGPKRANPEELSLAGAEPGREAGPRISTAWRPPAREEYTLCKRTTTDCWRSTSRHSGFFLQRPRRLSARAR